MTNRLANATSPYLRQHADNPVDWHEWGPDALAEARERDVPLLVSIGYAACHWCHVMAHESFEDEAVARVVNERFVPVKIDREERPDLDAVYMQATQAMTRQGGWPMTVFATPAGEPIFAGTYFPPQRIGRTPSFTEVCLAVSTAWRDDPVETRRRAAAIAEALAEISGPPPAAELDVDAAIATIREEGDPVRGGFGEAPKFPQATAIDALLAAGDEASVELAFASLDAMARGGIHDQLAGGFARYSVDADWIVPHFEKMLVDNALLLGAYATAWSLAVRSGDPRAASFERAAHGIVDWLRDVARTAEGAFAASTDADSMDADGRLVEGAFDVWTRAELDAVLGADDGARAAALLGVTDAGTFEHGASTLRWLEDPARPVDPAEWERTRAALQRARSERARPARDDKIVTAWNGYAIDALARAALVFGEPGWIDLADAAADAVLAHNRADGELRRASIDGAVGAAPAVAEDAGALATGLARLGAATGRADRIATARALVDWADEAFTVADGGYADAQDGASLIAARARDVVDDPSPSGTSALVEAGRLLARFGDDPQLAERAARAGATRSGIAARVPRMAARAVRDAIEDGRTDGSVPGASPAEVVVVHASGGRAAAEALVAAGTRAAPAGSLVVVGEEGAAGFGTLLEGRSAVGGAATAYVCRGRTCSLPVTTVEDLEELLAV